MLCEKCKIREATIQYIEVVNGVRQEHSLCGQCAKETGFGQVSALFDGDFPFAKILSTLLGEEEVEEDQNYAQIICPVCGTSYQEFVENSRFGCPDCYEMFDLLMRDSIKHLQGNETHKGKRPKYGLKIVPEGLAAELPGSTETRRQAAAQDGGPAPARSREEELRDLKVRLRQAIYEEAYERAAEYRDQIRKLEKEGGADA